MSRGLLEKRIRDFTFKQQNVFLKQRCSATGLIFSNENNVIGVKFRSRDEDNDVAVETNEGSTLLFSGNEYEGIEIQNSENGEYTLMADLVVDCMGSKSNVTQWLQAKFEKQITTELLDVDVFYSTQKFLENENTKKPKVAVSFSPVLAHETKGGNIFSLENNTALVTLNSFGEKPPTEKEAFLHFAKNLPSGSRLFSELGDFVETATPLTKPQIYNYTASFWRHFEHENSFPQEGLLCIGDSVATTNPLFNQGLMVAAIEAFLLDQKMRNRSYTGELEFQKLIATIINGVWTSSMASDLARNEFREKYVRKHGKIPLILRLKSWYMGKVFGSLSHPQIAQTILLITAGKANPYSLFYPKMLWIVLTQC
eukprot:TRINITY_DN2386_c0_g1_i1.p1 TRINITY_DN2386_c0_g1~~TRINITY_DN2386_c0_g1_i1.p1  ORF type:complete len:369 (+),score=86.44 TRINITY_DN2386_c0_g1_i1:578-1684(+)